MRVVILRSSANRSQPGRPGKISPGKSARHLTSSAIPRFLSGGDLHTLRGLFDKTCDSFRLRHVDSMAPPYLNDRRTSPLGHGTLGVRWDHLVVSSDQVPARLVLPRRFADLAAKSLHAPWDLGVGHERGFFCIHVGREGGGKLRLVEQQVAFLRRQYRRYGRTRRRILDKRGDGLALVRSKGGDIDESHNLGIVSSFSDYRSPVRVADENCRSVLGCKNALGS